MRFGSAAMATATAGTLGFGVGLRGHEWLAHRETLGLVDGAVLVILILALAALYGEEAADGG